MLDIIIDTLLDALKLIPFLFIAFIFIELIEHKFNNKSKEFVRKSGKFGPIIGSLLGIVPQCGFSVAATNLYITRVISLGTLFSIYLSTSDEMLPVMLSQNVPFISIFKLLLIKFVIGVIFGFVIDIIFRNKRFGKNYQYHICEEEHCDCEHSIILSSIKHTFNTIIFIIFITFILNFLFSYISEDVMSKLFLKNSLLGPFLSSLIGLIPNCGSSIMITELYLNNAINLGSCISGLLTGSGIALLVLFKSNRNSKENIFIMTTLYLIGVLCGIIIELIKVIF